MWRSSRNKKSKSAKRKGSYFKGKRVGIYKFAANAFVANASCSIQLFDTSCERFGFCADLKLAVSLVYLSLFNAKRLLTTRCIFSELC